jgi:ankyrin repeat protein
MAPSVPCSNLLLSLSPLGSLSPPVLHYAAMHGRTTAIKWLLTNTYISYNAADETGSTALHVATRFGEPEQSVNELCQGGGTHTLLSYTLSCPPLIHSSHTLSHTLSHALLSYTPLIHSLMHSLMPSSHTLSHNLSYTPFTPSHTLSSHTLLSHPPLTPSSHTLLSHHPLTPSYQGGARVDLADIDGGTPLHYAAQRGNVKSLNWLVEQGAGRALCTHHTPSYSPYTIVLTIHHRTHHTPSCLP